MKGGIAEEFHQIRHDINHVKQVSTAALKSSQNSSRTYKDEIEQYKKTINDLNLENEKLEDFKKKANEKILMLVGRLKEEQEKQKQLSSELDLIRKKMKKHKVNKIQWIHLKLKES